MLPSNVPLSWATFWIERPPKCAVRLPLLAMLPAKVPPLALAML
jgi:hypothetical protein